MINQKHAKAIIAIDKALTIAVYIFYPAMLLYLVITGLSAAADGLSCGYQPGTASMWMHMAAFAVVPGVSFVLVSIFRHLYNAPRPYEVSGSAQYATGHAQDAAEPIIKRDGTGKSFPSRHVFSIFMIAVTAFQLRPAVGIIIGIAGVVLAYCRVKGGVHFTRDVVAGAIIGIGLGIIGFAIWP